MFRKILCCAALMMAIAHTTVPAGACEGADCRIAAKSARPGKPLQLGKFMRPAKAKHVARAHKKHDGGHRPVAAARKHKPAPAIAESAPGKPATAATPPIPADAASAFASQPSEMRVVASDELNEIDRAAGPASAETTGAGPPAERMTTLIDAAEYNAIDRKSDELRLASLANEASHVDAPTRSDQASRSWIERFWARLQYTFVAVAAAVRYMIG